MTEREAMRDHLNAIGATAGLYGFYDREGKKIGMGDAAFLASDEDYVRIGHAEVGEYEVSTVWLTFDHSFGAESPLLFETMVWDGEGNVALSRRYGTEEEAKRGHADVLREVEANG